MDKLYQKFSSVRNLELAWARLKSAQNIRYKNYYRGLLLGYELAKKENIRNLHERLRGNSYKPYKVLRIFVPKSSGLHRPITFLNLDDQIVYQAFCNVIADKFSERRKEVEFVKVYSNILNRDKSKKLFFLKKWQEGYLKFIKKTKSYYNNGDRWVAHFDLAAYFDTICHNALCNLISKRAYKDFCDFLKKCLRAWSSSHEDLIHHGIPQGPVASSFISEIYMLPIDKALNKKDIKYVRYVDDIKIFGATREDVLKGVIILDKECKERGLIPQAKKYEIIQAKSPEEAIGKNPSITVEEKELINVNKKKTAEVFKEAFNESNFNISRIRYILKASEKNDYLFRIIMTKISSHPELAVEFSLFLEKYSNSVNCAKMIFKKTIKNPSPYEFVEGIYWNLLSNCDLPRNILNNWGKIAIQKLSRSKKEAALRLGLYKFIAKSNPINLLKWLAFEEHAFIQMAIAEHIEPGKYNTSEYWKLIDRLLLRNTYDPCLMIIKEPKRDDSNVLINTIGTHQRIDTIGQILKNRYSIPYSKMWRKLLANEYKHANNLLSLADRAFYIDRNSWVGYTNSFNDTLIKCFINMLNNKRPNPKWPDLIHKKGKSKGQKRDFGVLLDPSNQLSKQYPQIIFGIRKFNNRRRTVPTSHAYESKTGARVKYIKSKEQKDLCNYLKDSYEVLINVLNNL